MPRRNPFGRPSPRRRRRFSLAWLVILLALGAGGWWWWQSRQPSTLSNARPEVDPAQTRRRQVETNLAPPPKPERPPPVRSNLAPVLPGVSTNRVVRPSVGLPDLTSPVPSQDFPRPVRDLFEAQVVLARQCLSPGSIDGVLGGQTRAALRAFQRREGLPETDALDEATRAALVLEFAPLITYLVGSNDLARLQPTRATWLGKSQQSALDYETILELAAEKGRASPNLIRRLNPGVDWAGVAAGDAIQIPNVTNGPPAVKAAHAVIHLGGKQLQAFDASTNLLAHFPCSIAARFDKRPGGELRVVAIAENPNYTFNPEVFPESAEARQLRTKLILPPGPNNPVGTAWISLDKPGYGIHGTPSPEQVGRTESHGCFRLANWNAEYFLKLVWIGMPVYVLP